MLIVIEDNVHLKLGKEGRRGGGGFGGGGGGGGGCGVVRVISLVLLVIRDGKWASLTNFEPWAKTGWTNMVHLYSGYLSTNPA